MQAEISRRLAFATNELPELSEQQYWQMWADAAKASSFDALPSYIKTFIATAEHNVTKHMAGKHDQSSHGHSHMGEALDVSGKDGVSPNNSVSATAPHVGLSAKAQEVAARISPATRTENNNVLKATATYTDKDGHAYKLELVEGRNESDESASRNGRKTVSTIVDGSVTYRPLDQPAPSKDTRFLGEPLDSMSFRGAGYTTWLGESRPLIATISNIHVSPEYQSRGLATAMLEFARRESGDVAILHSSVLTLEGGLFAATTKSVEKHMAGQHDQSTHAGGKHIEGIPDHVDLEGKRFTVAAALELHRRAEAMQLALNEAQNAAIVNEFGKPLWEMPTWRADEILAGHITDAEGNTLRNPDGSYVLSDWREKALQDPTYLAAKANLEDHFLYKDAMSQLAYNEDGTRGPKTIGELTGWDSPKERFLNGMRVSAGGRYIDQPAQTDPAKFKQTDLVAYKDANGEWKSKEVTISYDEAKKISDEQWQKFITEGEPVFICSNKSLSSILASGRIKTYAEADRPARAGRADELYKNVRTTYENNAFGYKDTDDPAIRPVSTWFSSTNQMHPDLLGAYGGTQVVLKRDVLGRSTATVSDSLNGWEMPEAASHYLSMENAPRWTYKIGDIARTTMVRGSYWNTRKGTADLPELQVHGGVKVSDIDHVVFQDKVPANVGSKLDKLGIPYEVIPKVEGTE